MISSKYWCHRLCTPVLFQREDQALEEEVMVYENLLEDTASPKGVVRRQIMSPSDTDAN